MVGGQVNPITSIIIDDNNNNNDNNNKNNNNNNNNNIPLNGFSAPISQVGAEESVHINCSLPTSRSL